MKTNKLVIISALSIVLSLAGCAMPQTAPEEPRKPASFDYTPPATSTAGSAGMKIILVNPSYAEDFAQSNQEPYESFGKRMANDFEEVLSARGYTVYGPYKTYDEIIFAEKEIADLVLLTDIDIDHSQSLNRTQQATLASLFSSSTNPATKMYAVEGTMGITGKFTLKAREPQSGEQMWVKSVEIQPRQFSVASNNAWSAEALIAGAHFQDPGIFNPTVDALSLVYEEALGKAYTYLEPRELQTLRPQIERIKKRIRY